jgi:sugar lactone lactonase YvrE
MSRPRGCRNGAILLGGAVAVALAATHALAQTAVPPAQSAADPNGAPNPYQIEAGWLKMPEGRKMGQAISVDVDRDGKSIWVFDRCGGTECTGSMLNPIEKFDATGKFIRGFGDGMFNRPHGFHIDRDGNIWATDQVGGNGKGHQVFKFSPEGKVLLALGKPGVAGNGPDTFNSPTDVAVAPNGDIFVSDGHGGDTNARIVKFSRDGKFIKAWGKRGSGPGEFALNHSLAFDSTGRLFVADRANNRIEIFDQAIFSPNGSNSAGRAASSSTRTICSTPPIRNRTTPRIPASGAACASAASRMARSRPSFQTRPQSARAPDRAPRAGAKASLRMTRATSSWG